MKPASSAYDADCLKGVIRDYRTWRKENPDSWFDHCLAQTSLQGAIQVAARSVNAKGTMCSHQCRVGAVKLGYWADYLSQFAREIQQATTFSALHSLLENVRNAGKANAHITGIGELLLYDTAHRLGGYLNLLPQEVYIHSGTRTGARKLLGILPSRYHPLSLLEFPSAFIEDIEDIEEDVTASELEDILCLYKDDFHRCLTTSDSAPIKRQSRC